MAHELHHIGYAANCPSKETSEEIAKLAPEARNALKWIGAFGEGFAMLRRRQFGHAEVGGIGIAEHKERIRAATEPAAEEAMAAGKRPSARRG
jgi:hypothetical protein